MLSLILGNYILAKIAILSNENKHFAYRLFKLLHNNTNKIKNYHRFVIMIIITTRINQTIINQPKLNLNLPLFHTLNNGFISHTASKYNNSQLTMGSFLI